MKNIVFLIVSIINLFFINTHLIAEDNTNEIISSNIITEDSYSPDSDNYSVKYQPDYKPAFFKMFFILLALLTLIFLTFWLWVMLHLMGIKKKAILIIIHLLISLILELLFFYFLFTDVSMLGTTTKMSPVDIDFGPIAQVFLAYILIVFLISGFSFAIKTLKIDDPRPKLRGKFLLLAFLLYLIGAILELIIYSIINKLIILSSAIVFYIAFVMPEKIEKLFLKKEI